MSFDKCTQLWNHHTIMILNSFIIPKFPHSPLYKFPTTLVYFLYLLGGLALLKHHINGIVEHVAFESGFFCLHNDFAIYLCFCTHQ